MLAAEVCRVRHIVEAGPAEPSEPCYDAYAPFPLQHVGKLVLPPELRHLELTDDLDPPRNHCVVQAAGTPGLSVLRFTPFRINQSLNDVLGSPELIAELHERHLAKLGQLGLRPWFSQMAVGTHPSAPEGGLYILQDLLPPEAEVGLTRLEDRSAMFLAISQYHSWARTNGEPGCLEDIPYEDQGSKIGSQLVLHDVEPLYSVHIP